MPFANHTAMDYFPRRLHPQEYGDPFRVINLFFGWENFPGWSKHVEKWKDAALLPSYRLNNEETLQTFIRYEFIEILIEGLSMVQRLSNSFWLPDSQLLHRYNLSQEQYSPSRESINNAIGYFNNCYEPEEFELSAYSLNFLNEAESRRPLGVINEFFKFHSLPQWRDTLYWWLIVSMDYTSSDDSRGDAYLNEIYENLQRVIEASQLIYSWNMEKWPRLFAT